MLPLAAIRRLRFVGDCGVASRCHQGRIGSAASGDARAQAMRIQDVQLSRQRCGPLVEPSDRVIAAAPLGDRRHALPLCP